MISLALFQPDIAQNTGTMLRTAACLGVPVHLIHPAGFTLTDKGLKRAGMDYLERANLTEHDDWSAFAAWQKASCNRLVALTTRAETSLYDFAFDPDDTILMGRESAGLPEHVHASAEATLKIPQRPQTRSLNVAVAAGIAISEALRQTRQHHAVSQA
jgi:tRNA (cytidine/uridine-2'-O-)-methyltransferase